MAEGLGPQRRWCSSAPGHCQNRLEGFRRTGLKCATVEFVPGNYSPWKERLFILFSVTAWDCKAAVMGFTVNKDILLRLLYGPMKLEHNSTCRFLSKTGMKMTPYPPSESWKRLLLTYILQWQCTGNACMFAQAGGTYHNKTRIKMTICF